MLSAWKAPHCSFNLGHVGKGIQSCGRMISDADASRVKPAGCGTEVSPARALQLTPVLFSDHLVFFFFLTLKRGPIIMTQLLGSWRGAGWSRAVKRLFREARNILSRACTERLQVTWTPLSTGGGWCMVASDTKECCLLFTLKNGPMRKLSLILL